MLKTGMEKVVHTNIVCSEVSVTVDTSQKKNEMLFYSIFTFQYRAGSIIFIQLVLFLVSVIFISTEVVFTIKRKFG